MKITKAWRLPIKITCKIIIKMNLYLKNLKMVIPKIFKHNNIIIMTIIQPIKLIKNYKIKKFMKFKKVIKIAYKYNLKIVKIMIGNKT